MVGASDVVRSRLEGFRSSSRETVAGWTLKKRAAAAAVFSPSETIFRISDYREHVAQRARQPIQLPDNDHVTATKLIEEPEELGPLPTSTGSLLAKDAFAPSRFQRRHLSSGVLIVRGNAGVTDQHCIKVSLITLVCNTVSQRLNS